MNRPAFVFSTLLIAAAGVAATWATLLAPWPDSLALDGRDTWRTLAAATTLLTTFVALQVHALARARTLERRPSAAFALSLPLPISLVGYKLAYPVLPYAALWIAAWTVAALAVVALLAWTVTIVRLSRA